MLKGSGWRKYGSVASNVQEKQTAEESQESEKSSQKDQEER
jgi:hypothetical protein